MEEVYGSEAFYEALVGQGYCLIPTTRGDDVGSDMLETFRSRTAFERIGEDFEEAYLGQDASSKVAWLRDQFDDSDALPPVLHDFAQVPDYAVTLADTLFGFVPADSLKWIMLRQDEDASTGSGSDIEVEQFLDFIRRRRLCFMMFVSCEDGSKVELFPIQGGYEQAILPVAVGDIFIFRHDFFNYAYKPKGSSLVLQGWLLQEPRMWSSGTLSGSAEGVNAIIGARGAFIPNRGEVLITASSSTLGGRTEGIEGARMAYESCTDLLTRVPKTRWDHDLYYSAGGWEAASAGKASCQHAMWIDDGDLLSFDLEFFGFTQDQGKSFPRGFFKIFESGAQCLHAAGFDMNTVQGSHISLFNASNLREVEQRAVQPDAGPHDIVSYVTETQLMAHTFGLTGQTFMVDTACSAANYGANLAYQNIRRNRDATKHHHRLEADSLKMALVTGANYFADQVAPFVGMSAAHMLGVTGRCKTFDNSADGYARAETYGGMFLRLDENPEDRFNAVASVVSGFLNQDGRSASLTAPNGPSQTQCVFGALRDSGRSQHEMVFAEQHGTGTAIGDPIETGSTKVVMARGRGAVPFFHQSGKSMTGHGELSAGINGILKTIASAQVASVMPQCHLQNLNGNVDNSEGYPAHWTTENVDVGFEMNHCGVSSFGFGGSNARFDVWVKCSLGHRKVAPVGRLADGVGARVGRMKMSKKLDLDKVDVVLVACPRCSGNMCWKCGEADDALEEGRHVCKVVRKDVDSYDVCSKCYAGGYSIGTPLASGDAGDYGESVYVIGSWSAWSQYEEMKRVDDSYVCSVDLGESAAEQFRIVANKDPKLAWYPVVDRASQRARIQGPDDLAEGRCWEINIANDEELQRRRRCRIEFCVDYSKKSIAWSATDQQEALDVAPSVLAKRPQAGARSKTTYCMVSTTSKWLLTHEMMPVSDQPDVYFMVFSVFKGYEEFQIVVDKDWNKVLHPSEPRCTLKDISYAQGPDAEGRGVHWQILAAPGQNFKIELHVKPEGTWVALRPAVGKDIEEFARFAEISQARYEANAAELQALH